MIYFAYPWAWVLAIPFGIAYVIWAHKGHARWWRFAILLVLLTALSGLHLQDGEGGSDVVLILDRSQSMQSQFEEQNRLLQLIGEQRGKHDRLAIITVGAGTEILQGPVEVGLARLQDAIIEDYASDLRSGVEQALALIPKERSARVFIHTDGQYTGQDPSALASSFAARRIPVDVYLTAESSAADAAIMDIELPKDLRLGESYIGSVTFWSDKQETRNYTINRGQEIIASGSVELLPLQEVTINFADRPNRAGINQYTVQLDPNEDKQVGNNKAQAVLRVDGGEQVLVMSGDGSPGNVHRALEAAGLRVSSIPESTVSIEQLSAYKVLILDQVPAAQLGLESMQNIKTWVEKIGGGLVMFGGRRSFGAGGYHRSPIEEILPVSMELRDEHRKLSVAMAITMDRSGSMSAPVPGGLTKMDLANQGAIAAIELLGPHDAVAVHAVDSAPHIIIPLTPLLNPQRIIDQVRTIGSMGGGIYVYQALLAAGKEIVTASQATRHLILFADAADAEEPGDYKKLLEQYRNAGITVSVIGLGTEHDPDADFLKDVAKRGGGRIHFTEIPKDIPRLFAQETVLIARSSWSDQSVPIQAQENLPLIIGQNNILNKAWPQTNGYNLCYLKPNAQQYAKCMGDPQAPAIAAWHIGNGRSVAMPFAVDDPANTELIAWKGYAPLLASLVRWCAESNAQDIGVLRSQRFGDQVQLHIELDPEMREQWPSFLDQVELISANPKYPNVKMHLEAIDDGVYQATHQLLHEHVYLPISTVKQSALLGPAICLPYSPEHRPQLNDHRSAMVQLSKQSNGAPRQDIIDLFNNPPSPGASIDLSLYLVILCVCMLVIEIAMRRLQYSLRRKQAHIAKETSPKQAAELELPTESSKQTNDKPELVSGPDKDQGLHEALRQLRKKR